MSLIRACFPPFAAALLLTACVAKDVDLLGDLDAGDDASTDTGESSGATVGETGEPGETCIDPAHDYHVPMTEQCADPGVPLLPEAGCYEACQGPGASCTVGVCTQVQTQLECDAECCGAILELCLGDAPDTVCEQIVGTTFSSIEESICYPTKDGEEPVYCHSWVELEDDGTFLWMDGDFGQGGTYTCEGGVLVLDESFDIDVSFDPATGILTWDGDEYQPDVLCEQIVGTTYRSLEELECGLTPEGVALCHWQLTFEEDGDYLWMYSDVGQGGTYLCQGGNLFIDGEPPPGFAYDATTGILTWDGVDYVAEPA